MNYCIWPCQYVSIGTYCDVWTVVFFFFLAQDQQICITCKYQSILYLLNFISIKNVWIIKTDNVLFDENKFYIFFFYYEMEKFRLQIRLWNSHRVFKKFTFNLCSYGYMPLEALVPPTMNPWPIFSQCMRKGLMMNDYVLDFKPWCCIT